MIDSFVDAAGSGDISTVARLIWSGTNVNATNTYGGTALASAAENGHPQVVNNLLEANADVNHKDIFGATALIKVAKNGHSAVVEQLLLANADVNYANKHGSTALTIAAQYGHHVVVKQLLRAYADVNHVDKDGDTALICAAGNGHLAVIEVILEYEPLVDLCNSQGDTALLRAVRGMHEDIARILHTAGADPARKNSRGESAFSLLPEHSELAQYLRTIKPQLRQPALLEQLWVRGKHFVLTRTDLLTILKGAHITSFYRFIIAHNLLLLAVRQRVIGWDEVRMLKGDVGHVSEQVYLSVTKLDLSQEQKYLVWRILTYAEQVGFIHDGNASFAKVVAKLRSEICNTNLKLPLVRSALVSFARKISLLDHRTPKLEYQTEEAIEEFWTVCTGTRQIFRDVNNVTISLNELHAVLGKHQRNQIIAKMIEFCVSMIPVVSVGKAEGTCATSELDLGADTETVSSTAAYGVPALLEVDLSNYRSIALLTSKDFLSKLDPIIQKRIDCAVRHSEFESLPNLEQQVQVAVNELDEEKETLPISAKEEIELRLRFNALASSTHSGVVRANDAIEELLYMLHTRMKKSVKCEAVQQAVTQQMDKRTGRLRFASFLMVFSQLKRLCGESEQGNVVLELGERFGSASGPNSMLATCIAKPLLEELFRECGGESGLNGTIPFRRSTKDWNGSYVDSLLRQHGMDGDMIDEGGFVKVGVAMLFGAKEET